MKYCVKLTPQSPYFFGGETTFGEDDLQEYLVRSEVFPKSKSMEGMIKKYLMNKLGALKIRRKGEWIEKNDHFNRELAQRCDKAFSLSSIFVLSETNEVYVKTPINSKHPLKKTRGKSYLSGKKLDYSPLFDNYTAKKSLTDSMISENGMEILLWEEDETKSFLFTSVTQVGIRKPPLKYSKEEQSDGFYKKTSFQMKKDWGFGIYIDLDDDIAKMIDLTMVDTVEFGGERSLFKISFMLLDETVNVEEIYRKHYEKAVSTLGLEECTIVTSEMKINDVDMKNIPFGIIRYRSSRHKILSNRYEGIRKSSKYYLIEPGSVLYAPFNHSNTISITPQEIQK